MEILADWLMFAAAMVFIVGLFKLTGWRPLGWVFIVIGWERLVFYVRWLLYSRRYDEVHDFIAEADRRRRQPVAGLVEKRDETKP
jgi:Flp pilus assembly protein TadB